jgi:hypothetical protein
LILLASSCSHACGQKESPPGPPENDIRSAARAEAAVRPNDLNRAIALKRAIMEPGLDVQARRDDRLCRRYKNMDYVDRELRRHSAQWAIFIGADDSVQVRLCDDNGRSACPPAKFSPAPRAAPGWRQKSGPANRPASLID